MYFLIPNLFASKACPISCKIVKRNSLILLYDGLKVMVSVSGTYSPKFLPLPIDDPYRRKPDISLAKNLLNWSPKVNLMTGLKSTINYLAEN